MQTTERFQKAKAAVDMARTAGKKAERIAAQAEYVAAWTEMTGQEGETVASLKGTQMTTTKGKTFVTPFATDQEAATVLVDAGGTVRNEFAKSLVDQFAQRGSLSPRQSPWLHLLAIEARDAAMETAKKAMDQERAARIGRAAGACQNTLEAQGDEVDGGLQPIVDMLHKAGQSLKFPKIRFRGLRLSVAGQRSKAPGSVNVTSDESQYDDRTWYGRITTGGAFQAARGCPEKVRTDLEALAADPAGQAAAEGQRTGACCFCARELTAGDSLEVGYGPICAAKYGLPHGNA